MLGGFAFDYVAGVFSTSMVSINWSGDLLHGLDYTSVFFYSFLFSWCLKEVLGTPYSYATALQFMPGSVISSLSRASSKSSEEYVYGLFLFLVPTSRTMMNCLTQ